MLRFLALTAILFLAAISKPTGATTASPDLGGTSWALQAFQSSSDTIGVKKPEDPSRFTMTFNGDGTVHMQLDCNRAMGTYELEPGPDGSSGSFTFGPLAMTRALCPPPHLDEFVARQATYVRSYLLEGDLLHLSLMADGGIFTWKKITGDSAAN